MLGFHLFSRLPRVDRIDARWLSGLVLVLILTCLPLPCQAETDIGYSLASVIKFETDLNTVTKTLEVERGNRRLKKAALEQLEVTSGFAAAATNALRTLLRNQPIYPLKSVCILDSPPLLEIYYRLWIPSKDAHLKELFKQVNNLMGSRFFLQDLKRDASHRFIRAVSTLQKAGNRMKSVPERSKRFLEVYNQTSVKTRILSAKEELALLKSESSDQIQPELQQKERKSKKVDYTPSSRVKALVIVKDPELEIVGERKNLYDELWNIYQEAIISQLKNNFHSQSNINLIEEKMQLMRSRMLLSEEQMNEELEEILVSGVPLNNGLIEIDSKITKPDKLRKKALEALYEHGKDVYSSFEDFAFAHVFFDQEALDEELTQKLEE